MSRLFFYALLALVAGTAVALLLQDDPGYVLVNFKGWTLESTLGSVILGLLAIFIVFTGIIWLAQLVNPLKLFRRNTWRGMFSNSSPATETAKGLQLLLLGHWQDAYKLLVENAERVDTPQFNYLAAALAAFERNDRLGWLFCLDRAEKNAGLDNYGIKSLKGLLEAKSGQLEQGLAILLSLRRLAPGSPFVLRQIKDIYLQLPDCENLALLLPDLEKYKVVSDEEYRALQEKVFHHRLAIAAREGLEEMRLVYREIPKSLRNSERLTGLYLDKLLHFGQDTEAASILTGALKNSWSDNLIGLLGFIAGGNPQHMLLLLENWLRERPNNAVLLLTLGRLSLRNQLWGKGRDYYEHALRVSQSSALTAEISAELGRLLEHLGESERSLACYQRAMSLMEHQLPELPMPALLPSR